MMSARGFSGSGLWKRTIRSAIRSWRYTAWRSRTAQAVLCRDIHAKILVLRYFTEGDHMQATGSLLSYRDLPWGEVYYRQFYGRCIMRLARMFGNRLADFRNIMEGLNGIPRQYGGRGL